MSRKIKIEKTKAFWSSCMRSYEMSWFPEHQPLEKDYNSSSSAHKWPWWVSENPALPILPRCAVFTKKEMKILEDNEDLFYYHQVVPIVIS